MDLDRIYLLSLNGSVQDLNFELCLPRADRWQAFNGLFFVFCVPPGKADEKKPQLHYHEYQGYNNDTWRVNSYTMFQDGSFEIQTGNGT